MSHAVVGKEGFKLQDRPFSGFLIVFVLLLDTNWSSVFTGSSWFLLWAVDEKSNICSGKGLGLCFPPCVWERRIGISSSKEVPECRGFYKGLLVPVCWKTFRPAVAFPEADSLNVSPSSAETPGQRNQNRGDHFPISYKSPVKILLRKLCKGHQDIILPLQRYVVQHLI